jgi:hypothetical protein
VPYTMIWRGVKRIVGLIVVIINNLNYGIGTFVMLIELARTKCSKCMIKFLCGRRSVRLRWGIKPFLCWWQSGVDLPRDRESCPARTHTKTNPVDHLAPQSGIVFFSRGGMESLRDLKKT